MSDEKSWQSLVTPEIRHGLVQKLLQGMFRSSDDQAMKQDEQYSKVVEFVTKIDQQMFDTATSRAEYYLSLAQKFYQIQTELDEKQKEQQDSSDDVSSELSQDEYFAAFSEAIENLSLQ